MNLKGLILTFALMVSSLPAFASSGNNKVISTKYMRLYGEGTEERVIERRADTPQKVRVKINYGYIYRTCASFGLYNDQLICLRYKDDLLNNVKYIKLDFSDASPLFGEDVQKIRIIVDKPSRYGRKVDISVKCDDETDFVEQAGVLKNKFNIISRD